MGTVRSQSALSLIALLVVFAILILLYGRIVIQNDGISYYAMTVSLLRDGDFDLTNQSQKFPETRIFYSKITHKQASRVSCGFALLYAPFLFVTDTFSVLQSWMPYGQNTRFPFLDSLGIFAGSVTYGFLTVLCGSLLLIRLYAASRTTANLIAIALFLGTSLMFYTFVCPSFTHAADAFLVAFAFLLTVAQSTDEAWKIRLRNIALGFTLALSVLLRNNNIVLVPIFVLGRLYFEGNRNLKKNVITCAEIFAGAIPILGIQLYFNFNQYGRFLTTGYTEATQKLSLVERFRVFNLLIDPVKGIFVWHPITFLAVVGLIAGIVRHRKEAALSLISVAVVILSITFVGKSSPGAAFGQRLLAHLYIFWLVGLYQLFLLIKRPVVALSILSIFWTFLLLNVYFVVAAHPKQVLGIGTERGFHTFRMLRIASDEYRIARETGDTTGPIQFWSHSLGARPYPTVLFILFRSKPV